MAEGQGASPNAREVQYWNSAAARAWAEQDAIVDRMFAGVTEAALGLAAPRRGERVVDIGCGNGSTVIELAARVGTDGHVLGLDVSRPSVERARARIAGLPQAEVVLADVSTHVFAPDSFDLAFSRLGVMFFADPVATFANLRGAMKPGGRLALAVLRSPAENGWATGPLAAVRHLLPPQAPPAPDQPHQFSWADPDRVRRILEGAGFRDVVLTPHDPPVPMAGPGGAAEAADFAMRLGPVVRATLDASPEQREAVRSALESFFAGRDGPQGIVLSGAIWTVGARA
jgi:SAM-dependent methyltransferase